MQFKQIRRLPVIYKNKRMVGILSLGDLSHAASERTGRWRNTGGIGASRVIRADRNRARDECAECLTAFHASE
jgi:CBS-domain-containing membrane protein